MKGPKGELSHTLAEPITAERADDGTIQVTRPNDERKAKELHGLSRTLVANMIVGVTEGYRKSLEINGTGYRVTAKGSDLEFALGFSHPVVIQPPAGISFTVERPTLFTWPASTSSWWVRSPRTSARSARRSPTRARA